MLIRSTPMSPRLKTETNGERIRSRRRSLYMTQAQLAKACGVTQSAVGQWERDETTPALRLRPVLAGALHMYPHQLFDDLEELPA
jgi:transcriptional regulator with XRE-family HTH domain